MPRQLAFRLMGGNLDGIVQAINRLPGSRQPVKIQDQDKTFTIHRILQFQIVYVQGTPEAVVLTEAEAEPE
jgi:hypothetical protein